jgi:hypothetical protein
MDVPVCQAFGRVGLKGWIAAMHPDYERAWRALLMERQWPDPGDQGDNAAASPAMRNLSPEFG